MDHIIDTPAPSESHGNKQNSTFSAPIFIEMGDEDSEYLEAKIKEQTSEIVKADEDWTRLSGTCTIDVSVVGGFMYQTDAGSGCSIEVIENEHLPARILIDRDQDFAMFLVAVLRYEKWTTCGEFYLRFLRRVPVLDQSCIVRIQGWVAGTDSSPSDAGVGTAEEPGTDSSPSDAGVGTAEEPGTDSSPSDAILGSAKEPGSSYSNELSVDGDWEEQEAADRTTVARTSLPVQVPFTYIFKDVNPDRIISAIRQPTSQDSTTDEEDWPKIGAAALRKAWGSVHPPGKSPPPE